MKEGEDILRKEYNNNLINNKLIIKIKHRIFKEKWKKKQKLISKLKYSQQILNIDYSDDNFSSFEEAINDFYWNSKTLQISVYTIPKIYK